MLEYLQIICILILLNECSNQHLCPEDHYYTETGCHTFLSCQQVSQIQYHQHLTDGYVKTLKLGYYDQLLVVYSVPRDVAFKDDFLHGIKMLVGFQHSKYVVEVVGYCMEPTNLMLVTKFMKHSSADKIDEILIKSNYNEEDVFQIRLNLCLDYLFIIEFLHNSPLGVRVMCDSNDLQKTLSQFLITDQYRLIVSDLDALPEVNITQNLKIKCGHRQLFGDFVAPEQLWLHTDFDFDDNLMPAYTEKVDIWKIPDVLLFLLGDSILAKRLRFHVFDILSKCKNIDPMKRPTATEVRIEFHKILSKFRLKAEL